MASAAAPAPRPAPPPTQAQQQQPKDQQQQALAVNALRLKVIGDRIRTHLRGMSVLPAAQFAHLVYAFARGIDFALSAGDVPEMAVEIPNTLRKVYDLRKDPFIQSSVMVLVISCKAVLQNACFNNWFQPTDSTDILRMANELSGNFCTSLGQSQTANDSSVLEIISKIMPRYYPQLKFERLVTSMEAKVGYDVLMADFFIERNLPRDERIRLIVVQKENLDASSCITSPPHVSFLVNGKGVDKRTNVSMEMGPQFPTDITKMLKYGANIIQAVGYFNASYIIAVAFVNNLTSFGAPRLDDYAQPVTVDSADSDVLEGPSRVSLNCPISFRRIKTPIKGRLCKHYQCFDYDNYTEMNLRKPTWRCPYCNTPSNFIDLRIDQKMAKILQETGGDVIDVFVFTDGSWKAAPANDEKSDRRTGHAIQQTGDTVETDSSSSHVIDLINRNDDGDLSMNWASASEDTKPLLNSQDLSVADYLPDFPISAPAQTEDLYPGDANNGVSNMALTSRQNLLLPSTTGLASSTFGTLESILPQNVLRPVITDAVSPSLETSNSISGMQHVSQETHREIVQLQPQIGPLHGSEMRRPPIPRNPRRELVGVQALPVPPQNLGSSRRLQPNILNCPPPIPLSSPASSQAHQVINPDSVIAPMNNGGGPLPRTPSTAIPSHLQSTTLDMHNTSSHLPSQVVGLPTPHLMGIRPSPGIPGQAGGANAYRAMPTQQTPTLDQLRLHTRMNQTAQAAAGQSTAATQILPTQADIQSHLFPTQQSQALRSPTVPQAATPQARAPPHLQSPSVRTVAPSTPQTTAAAQIQPTEADIQSHLFPTQQSKALRSPTVPRAATSQARPPPHLQSPSVQTVAPSASQAGASDGLPELPVGENWCPTGQMRGSLTGSAYSTAIRRYLGQQSAQQQSQARPH
ncbi:E4 SUMO-protein ligase PIAL2 isoform X2 [Phragmites australis]|uniref:E4 SUMO-protein ligase PIAL2 isoform X2 n=1 Tax=Phragmites australis TaxID=29695 RepID=UPI002D76CBC7|nr:E4 SUMO-protein ligase PIAL2 isoform X2 [Phragmites australis]